MAGGAVGPGRQDFLTANKKSSWEGTWVNRFYHHWVDGELTRYQLELVGDNSSTPDVIRTQGKQVDPPFQLSMDASALQSMERGSLLRARISRRAGLGGSTAR